MIRNFTSLRGIALLQPSRIAFGAGVATQCIDYLKTRGSREIILLASGSCLKSSPGFADDLKAAFPNVEIRTGIPPEPSIKDLEDLLEACAGRTFDTAIGLGGGSVLDVTKLFSVLHGKKTAPRDILGDGKVEGRDKILVCLPTTAGAGSEVSPNAVLFDEATNLKQAAISPWLMPDAAFVDPRFTLSVPPETTAATGFDALSHCIEAYTSNRSHPLVDRLAADGIELITAHLEAAVLDGSNLEARSGMALGSMFGGLCLGPVNTAGVHALSYPLGSSFRLPHGLTNAILLPQVMGFNLVADTAKYARIALLMGFQDQGDEESTARNGIQGLKTLMRKCRLPGGMEALGVSREEIPGLADAAMKVERLLKNNPRPITRADAELIYQQSF